jgi:hypothetical protein
VLEDSLHGAALQTLGLEARPDAVPDRWGAVLQQPDRTARPLDPGTTATAVFDDVDGELLILGAPGSGKTTLLLELAGTLLDRAGRDEALPMPVVFPLVSWTAQRLPLADWLVDELSQRYDVAVAIGRAWVTGDRVLPLLDGLDEVAAEHRGACVAAINAFRARRTGGLTGLVVTCRRAEYEALGVRLRLRGAVLLRPLSSGQIDAYLGAGPQLDGVRAALEADEILREMAASPLLLSTITLAYRDVPAEALPRHGTPEERRRRVWAAYVEAMFVRRSPVAPYGRRQTVRWLAWLANALTRQNLTLFHLERLQPEWLPSTASRRWYALVDRLGWAVLGGVLFGLVFGVVAGAPMSGVHLPPTRGWAYLGLALAVPVFGLFGGRLATAGVARRRLRAAAGDAVLGGLAAWVAAALLFRAGRRCRRRAARRAGVRAGGRAGDRVGHGAGLRAGGRLGLRAGGRTRGRAGRGRGRGPGRPEPGRPPVRPSGGPGGPAVRAHLRAGLQPRHGCHAGAG